MRRLEGLGGRPGDKLSWDSLVAGLLGRKTLSSPQRTESSQVVVTVVVLALACLRPVWLEQEEELVSRDLVLTWAGWEPVKHSERCM